MLVINLNYENIIALILHNVLKFFVFNRAQYTSK